METTSESFDNNSEETTETQESENDSDDSVTDDSASIPHSHESTEKAGEKIGNQTLGGKQTGGKGSVLKTLKHVLKMCCVFVLPFVLISGLVSAHYVLKLILAPKPSNMTATEKPKPEASTEAVEEGGFKGRMFAVPAKEDVLKTQPNSKRKFLFVRKRTNWTDANEYCKSLHKLHAKSNEKDFHLASNIFEAGKIGINQEIFLKTPGKTRWLGLRVRAEKAKVSNSDCVELNDVKLDGLGTILFKNYERGVILTSGNKLQLRSVSEKHSFVCEHPRHNETAIT